MRRFNCTVLLFTAVALLGGCAQSPSGTAAGGPDTPGWTGRTVVVGTNSTIGGDAQATYWSQKWGIGRRN